MEVQVKVAKEVHELAQGMSDFTLAIAEALKDGWQIGRDLPVVMSAALTKLVPAVSGVEKIKGEFEVSKKEVILGALLPVVDCVEALVK